MTEITGREPKHWHGSDGKHRMPDMRRFAGYSKNFWDSDERAYVAHLEAHEGSRDRPVPEPGDSAQIKSLFQMINVSEKAAKNARLLIIALRQAEASVDKESTS
jgi:hypothetical protein